MAGNGLELYPVVGFCISDVELIGSAITLLVNLLVWKNTTNFLCQLYNPMCEENDVNKKE